VVVRSAFALDNLGGCCCWLLARWLAFALAILVAIVVPGGGDEWIRPLERLIFLLKQRHLGAAPY
jgi:hypothetical protein